MVFSSTRTYQPYPLPYLTLPYLRGGRHTRQHPVLRPPGGQIAHPRKAKGYQNLPEALASFMSKGHRMFVSSSS